MARTLRSLTTLMIGLMALAGSASAGASLVGGVAGSVDSDRASAAFDGDAAANVATGAADVTGAAGASASARGHEVGVAADAEGQLAASVDGHEVGANVGVKDASASVTVDGTTVSTDDLPELDTPEVPEVGGSLELHAMLSAVVDGFASLTATLSAFLGW